MNRQKAIGNVGKLVTITVNGDDVPATLVTPPDKGGNVLVNVYGGERETNITQLRVHKQLPAAKQASR